MPQQSIRVYVCLYVRACIDVRAYVRIFACGSPCKQDRYVYSYVCMYKRLFACMCVGR